MDNETQDLLRRAVDLRERCRALLNQEYHSAKSREELLRRSAEVEAEIAAVEAKLLAASLNRD